jgi:hypothetical protein
VPVEYTNNTTSCSNLVLTAVDLEWDMCVIVFKIMCLPYRHVFVTFSRMGKTCILWVLFGTYLQVMFLAVRDGLA